MTNETLCTSLTLYVSKIADRFYIAMDANKQELEELGIQYNDIIDGADEFEILLNKSKKRKK